jgi:hypothetical protein
LSSTSPEDLSGIEALRLVEEQVALGPRVPGTEEHDRLGKALAECLRACTPEVTVQEFPVPFRGKNLSCANVIGVFRAKEGTPAAGSAPILLGTHYDTRPRADRETERVRRETPIPGANDGGSGTAVLLHMLGWLARRELTRDVVVVFFDAEDLGGIDGKEYSIGAEFYAENPPPGLSPAEVIVLDMVGGAGMVFDIDAHILRHPPSRTLTSAVFRAGASRGFPPFVSDKPHRLKYIVSDHRPFATRGIASCILIDIDYPQWHTGGDLPAALSAASLGITEAALSLYLSRFRG